MSYSIRLRPGPVCSACGRGDPEPECPDPTYNLTPIFDFALTGEALPNPEVGEGEAVVLGHKTDRPRGLRLLNGRKAATTINDLDIALVRFSDPRLAGTFAKLAPSNGWGTLADALWVLGELGRLAAEYPDATWEVT